MAASAAAAPQWFEFHPPSSTTPVRVQAQQAAGGDDECESLGGDAASVDATGAVPWQAMPLLCYWVLSSPARALLTGARVLELGAGVGVPGLLAGRWCSSVVLTDNNPAVVDTLRASLDLNKPEVRDRPRVAPSQGQSVPGAQ